MAVSVKICGLTWLADVEHAIESGADLLGFVLEPSSPRYVRAVGDLGESLIDLVTPVSKVAVFGPYEADPLESSMDFTQCAPPYSDPSRWLRIVRLRADTNIDSIDLDTPCRAIVLDAWAPNVYGGSGQIVDWGAAAELVHRSAYPVILAGGLNPDNVAEAIRKVRPSFVDASSGLESHPGKKDPEKVRAFIHAVKGA